MALGPEGLALESGEGAGGAGTGGTDGEMLTPRVVRCPPAALGDGEEALPLHPGRNAVAIRGALCPPGGAEGGPQALGVGEGSGQVGSGLGPPGYPLSHVAWVPMATSLWADINCWLREVTWGGTWGALISDGQSWRLVPSVGSAAVYYGY